MSNRNALIMIVLAVATTSVAAEADPLIFEGFSGYPDDALISENPAGPATGLTGDWSLDAENFFYVNRTEADLEAGTGKAVYDMPFDDNGARTAQRQTSQDFALFDEDGDAFYASFLIHPPRADGDMLFTLILEQLSGGGQTNLSFGISAGTFIVGNGIVDVDVEGGVPTSEEILVVLRIEYGDGGTGPDDFEVVTLWANPINESSLPVIDAVPVDLLNRGGGRITAVSMRGRQMAGEPALIDDLAVGFTFDDVTAVHEGGLTNDLGMNGLFYDPNNPGHGFNFILHSNGFTAYYYGHTAEGERLWLMSETLGNDLEFDVAYELEMYEVLSGVFGQPQLPATTWGTVTLLLADCDTGQASFDGLDGFLEMDFVRLTAMPGIYCQQQ
jgi:hypothetical protein